GVTSGTGGAGSTSSVSSTTGGAGGASSNASSSSSTGAGGGDDCEAIAASIAKTTTGVGACTTTVRLDYQSKKLLGHHFVCGAYASPTEAQARLTAQTDTGFGASGEQLAGPSPQDAFVFYESPGDFGGAAAVARSTGLATFGGSIVWSGTGQITYPLDWLPPSALGPGCGPKSMIPPPPARGFNLQGGTPLPDAEVQAAIDVVWSTALPYGLAKVGYLFDVVVLLYPRTVGVFDPTNAEWIVLVDSGYLE
ncbi:MAG: hypothetical protein ABI193_06670, partial [Minicystis sp.]